VGVLLGSFPTTRRRILALVAVLAAIAASLFGLRAVGVPLPGFLGGPAASGEQAPALAGGDDLGAAARDEAGRLQRFPGMRLDRHGTGSIVGRVTAFVAGAGEKPLEGVTIDVVGVADGGEARAAGETDAEGAFHVAPVAALSGCVLRARHASYRDLVVRGLVVAEGRATDVGTLVFGRPTTLEGSVVDGAGRPVAGALVSVERDRSRNESIDLLRALRDIAEAPGPVATAQSEGDGAFLLRDLPPGRYLLRVTRAGHAAAFVGGVYVTADGDAASVRVVLDPGAGFEGRVLDEGGRGVDAATVVAVAVKAERADSFDRQETRSGPDGRYRLDTLTPGASYFLEAHRRDLAPLGKIVVARGVQPLDFVLAAGGRLEGVVTDAKSGAPLAQAEVLAVTGFVGAGTAPVSTVADASGRYAFEHVIPGPLVLLEVRATGYGPSGQGYDAKAPKQVVGGETLVVDVALSSGGVVAGTVRGDDGRPVAWASVAATQPGNRFGGETATLSDAHGAYRLLGLRWGAYVMAVTAPGWASPVEEADVRVEVSVASAEVARDFTLHAGAVVLGRITTPDGEGAAAAQVAVVAKDARTYGTRVRDLVGVADGSGAYRVAGAPAGLDLVLEATVSGGVKTTSAPFRAKAGESKTVDLVAKPGARIVGRAVTAAGRGLAGARVRYGHVEPEDLGRLRDSFRADEFLTGRTFRADDDGRFVCDRVPSGTTIVKVEADGFAAWFRKDLVVPADGDLVGVTATLDGALSIRGRVLSSDTGRGIAGAWVYATGKDVAGAPKDEGAVRPLVSAETGPDGGYLLEHLPPGAVDVVVWLALGYRTAWDDPTCRRDGVSAGSPGVDFRLVSSASPPLPGR